MDITAEQVKNVEQASHKLTELNKLVLLEIVDISKNTGIDKHHLLDSFINCCSDLREDHHIAIECLFNES